MWTQGFSHPLALFLRGVKNHSADVFFLTQGWLNGYDTRYCWVKERWAQKNNVTIPQRLPRKIGRAFLSPWVTWSLANTSKCHWLRGQESQLTVMNKFNKDISGKSLQITVDTGIDEPVICLSWIQQL